MLKLKISIFNINVLAFYIFKKFYINIILFFFLFQTVLNECDIETPIKLNNDSCVMKYYTKDEYESKECVLNNSIIKTQFPNNLIILGDFYFRFLIFYNFLMVI